MTLAAALEPLFLMDSATLAAAANLHVARFGALLAFAGVLLLLGFGLWQARRKLAEDEADAALETHFQQLERELAVDPAQLGRSEGFTERQAARPPTS